MNKLLMPLVLTVALFLAPAARAGSDRFARKPHVGMTKAEATKIYGRPDTVGDNSRGEEWVYLFNKAQYFNPFAVIRSGGDVESGSLFFRNGKVSSFRWGGGSSGGHGSRRNEEAELHN